MKFAAIDIGSNAVRLLIEEVFELDKDFHIQKVSFTRVPIRLGEDVFSDGVISSQKRDQLIKTMKAFWYLMDVHDIEYFRACATSAMREASNGEEVVATILKEANLPIEIISGKKEADLLFDNFTHHHHMDLKKSYLYIDVGGGSTELTLIKNGQRMQSRSFRIGTVRMLKGKTKNIQWKEAKSWIEKVVKDEKKLTGIGVGGNINKIYKLSRRKMWEPITFTELQEVYQLLKNYTYEERISEVGLKPDRADVIIPASEIYLRMMEMAGVRKMYVPGVGVSDGIVLNLYKDWKKDQSRKKRPA